MLHPLPRRLLAATLACLLAGLVGPAVPVAYAAEAAPILVVPYANIGDVPEDLGAKTAELIGTELKANEAVRVVDMPAQSAPKGKKEAEPAEDPGAERDIQEAREAVEQGKSDLVKGKFKQAANAFEKAVKGYKERHAALKDFAELVDAIVQLAAAQYRLGEEEDGERLLAEAVRLDPNKELDTTRFPPLFLRVFAGTKKKTLGRARGSLKIVSRPSGGKVVVDGREVGAAPIIVKDVVEGEHYLRVGKEGAHVFTQVVKVPPSKATEVEAELSDGGELAGPLGDVVSTLGKNRLDQAAIAKLKAACNQAVTLYAIFGATYKDGANFGVTSFLYNVRTGAVAALSPVTFDPDLLGASIEVYKIAGEVADKVKVFPAGIKLPVSVARVEEEAKVAEVSVASAAPSKDAGRGPLKPADKEEARRPVEKKPLTPLGVPEDENVAAAKPAARGPLAPAGSERKPVTGGSRVVVREAGSSGSTSQPAHEAPADEGDLAVTGKHDESEEGADEEPRAARRRMITAVEPDQIVIPEDEKGKDKVGGTPWWVWGIIGGVAAGAAAGGGVYLYNQSREPQTATATFTWSP